MAEPLPVRKLNIKEYVREYEQAHPQRKPDIPVDPKSRWFKKDPLTECVEACRFELFKTAEKEGLHARYALLQPDCLEACKLRHSQQ